MKVLLSPAKSMKQKQSNFVLKTTKPLFNNKTNQIISVLSSWNTLDFKLKMKTNDSISQTTFDAFQSLKKCKSENRFPSIYYYDGIAFKGLSATNMSIDEINYAQNHLFVLSGLYGLLRPLDLIEFYRLEMALRFQISSDINSLYEFWSHEITSYLNKCSSNEIVVNLASNEYSKVIDTKTLTGKFITCHFLEVKNGTEKIVSSHAKRARGMMANFIMVNKLKSIENLKLFNLGGYIFREDLSSKNNIYFSRES
jgi:uncharacterized protein